MFFCSLSVHFPGHTPRCVFFCMCVTLGANFAPFLAFMLDTCSRSDAQWAPKSTKNRQNWCLEFNRHPLGSQILPRALPGAQKAPKLMGNIAILDSFVSSLLSTFLIFFCLPPLQIFTLFSRVVREVFLFPVPCLASSRIYLLSHWPAEPPQSARASIPRARVCVCVCVCARCFF